MAAVDVSGPLPTSTPAPIYPDFAREAQIEGTVLLHVRVGKDGRVRTVKVVKSITGLDQAAVEAVKEWRFEPALAGNEPIEVWMAVPMVFQLGPRVAARTPVDSGLPRGYQLKDVSIELTRTGCFGTCPAYRLLIQGTGECTYTGSAFVRQEGDVPFHVEPQVVFDLLKDLYGMEFFNFRDSYLEGRSVALRPDGTVAVSTLVVSDVPNQIVTVRIGSYVKRVETNSMFGPNDLVNLLAKIDRVTNSSQWIQVEPVQSR